MRASIAASAPPPEAPLAPQSESNGASSALVWLAVFATLVLLGAAAWIVRDGELYTPRQGLGYWLGATGGSLMVLLLTYPARKRLGFMRSWGPLKHWFRMHMMCGVAGPVLVMFHSTFHVGSLNAGIAMGCMLLVMSSGFIGRVLYRKIHHGLYGSRANLQELERELARDLQTLAPVLERMPAVKQEVERFTALSAGHFLFLGWRRLAARRRVRRALSAYDGSAAHMPLDALLKSIDVTLREVQRAAQFSTYERLFSIWHAVHIPFLSMLVLTAVTHVVVVHFY